MSGPDSVREVLDGVTNGRRRRDAEELVALMSELTGDDPTVWSAGTIGFGHYHYRYASGEAGEFFHVGLAPRKDKLTLYVMSGLRGFDDILERLGPHTTGKSTVHLRSLDGVDRAALSELITECVRHLESVEAELGAIPRMSEIPPRQP